MYPCLNNDYDDCNSNQTLLIRVSIICFEFDVHDTQNLNQTMQGCTHNEHRMKNLNTTLMLHQIKKRGRISNIEVSYIPPHKPSGERALPRPSL